MCQHKFVFIEIVRFRWEPIFWLNNFFFRIFYCLIHGNKCIINMMKNGDDSIANECSILNRFGACMKWILNTHHCVSIDFICYDTSNATLFRFLINARTNPIHSASASFGVSSTKRMTVVLDAWISTGSNLNVSKYRKT